MIDLSLHHARPSVLIVVGVSIEQCRNRLYTWTRLAQHLRSDQVGSKQPSPNLSVP